MAAVEEDRCGLEAKVARLTVERTSLLLGLKASKDEVSAFHSQASKDKEAIVEDYQKALKQIFAYGILGDRPKILDGMPDSADPLPPEFFANLGCPSALTTIEAMVAEVLLVETTKDWVEGHRCRGVRLTFSPILVSFILGDFCKGRHFATIMHITSCNHWRCLAHFNEIWRC